MSNGEYGTDNAEIESMKMEVQQGIASTIEQMRSTNYSNSDLNRIESNSKELLGSI